VYVAESEASLDVPQGSIIRQDPKVNEEAEIGSEVKVYISIGVVDGLIKVPDLMGKTEQEAREIIDENKLIAEVVYAENKNKPNGTVLSQDPEKDLSATELSKVIIVVNKIAGSPDTKPDDNTPSPSDQPTAKRTVTIDLKNKGTRDVFMVRVEVQGQTLGTRTEYEEMHSRSDGKITVPISEPGSGIIKVYIDDVLDSEQVIPAL
jgi:serine/threonine-protein kinase